jgi:hypothetical protein
MPVAKKIATKKPSKKGTSSATVEVVRKRIAANDTLFPEKVARAKKILSNTRDL